MGAHGTAMAYPALSLTAGLLYSIVYKNLASTMSGTPVSLGGSQLNADFLAVKKNRIDSNTFIR